MTCEELQAAIAAETDPSRKLALRNQYSQQCEAPGDDEDPDTKSGPHGPPPPPPGG